MMDLQSFIQQAREDLPVYITDVREAFQRQGTRPLVLRFLRYDGSWQQMDLQLPKAETEEEKSFVSRYVYAIIYNTLSAAGARRLDLYFDRKDTGLQEMADKLNVVFGTEKTKAERTGYGKCLNVNERILSMLFSGGEAFRFVVHSIEELPALNASEEVSKEKSAVENTVAEHAAQNKILLGMDIGGTDIKFAVSVFGKLAVCKEFDWNPASAALAEEILDPVCMLVRLLQAAASLYAAGKEKELDETALSPHASFQEMRAGIERMEQAAGSALRRFDGIGVSFPDVVIDNKIIGGETPKTAGLRANEELDYETQFRKITLLQTVLADYVTEDGRIAVTNDGNMAAFTAAVEQAADNPQGIRDGFFAHSLGTDLGSGWVKPDGSIPDLPLEIYNFIIDLGSSVQSRYPSEDLRSTRNLTTDLPGSLQRYTGQGGVFRLAAKYLPQQAPALWQEVKTAGFFEEDGEMLRAVTQPEDRRKPALEFFMQKAEDGHPVCREIFRQIGEYLAVTWSETEAILHPEAKARNLFGRFVRKPACFTCMVEGARRRVPDLQLYAADSSHSCTSLMKQLDAMPDYTVAQFGQAVGAVYFAAG